ncbi:MAG: DUF3842 family protein [Ruminococcaceae bacterium]|nr:DUF3842 family protein [Oscillospiraceae bacterium]
MNITIIDGHGGMLGAQLVKEISAKYNNAVITAIGTNSSATTAMLKAGAKNAATGENPVIVACRRADVIIGPVGIVIADSLTGEITPNMAIAIAQADATRILVPMNKCDNLIAGIKDISTAALIEDVIAKLDVLTAGRA